MERGEVRETEGARVTPHPHRGAAWGHCIVFLRRLSQHYLNGSFQELRQVDRVCSWSQITAEEPGTQKRQTPGCLGWRSQPAGQLRGRDPGDAGQLPVLGRHSFQKDICSSPDLHWGMSPAESSPNERNGDPLVGLGKPPVPRLLFNLSQILSVCASVSVCVWEGGRGGRG